MLCELLNTQAVDSQSVCSAGPSSVARVFQKEEAEEEEEEQSRGWTEW